MVFLFSAKMGNVYTFKLLHWTVVEASKSGLNSISISVTNSKADNDLGIGSSYLFIFILSYSTSLYRVSIIFKVNQKLF